MDIDASSNPSVKRAKVRVTPDGRARRKDAARYIGHSEKTLANWATQGKGPRCVRVSGRCFYYLTDLDAFIRGEAVA
jgi:hypothetical protein